MFRNLTVPVVVLSATLTSPAFAQASTGPLAKMTVWSMFLNADWVVKFVMLILFGASIVTWGICIAKYLEFRNALRALRGDQEKLAAAKILDDVGDLECGVSSAIFGIAKEEIGECRDLSSARSTDAMTDRLSVRLSAIEANCIQHMRSGFSFLASVGATAPFIGLFGTVWGIMNSFIGISQAQTTNLAVVAPGIAEALLATAFGLVAAIPAVLLYNVFSRRMAEFRRHVHTLTARIACLVSREVERAQVSRLKVAV